MWVVLEFDYDDIAVNNVYGPFATEEAANDANDRLTEANTTPDIEYQTMEMQS